MKLYFTLIMSFFVTMSIFAQQKKDLYIIDFHNAKEYNSILGKNVANEFENSLQLCKSKYRIIPRMKYQRQLEGKTFEYTKRFLKKEGIDYVVYGDIFHDDNSKHFTIEYIFEEVSNGSIILIETINFDHISKLVNASNRKQAIVDKLKNDEELCKRFSERPSKPTIIDEDAVAKAEPNLIQKDDDNDGVPNALDKEPDTPIGAIIDQRGVEIMSNKGSNSNFWKEGEKGKIREMLPDFPEVSFNNGKSDLNDDAYMKIDQMAQLMKMYPIVILKLEGLDTENETLAFERSKKIKDFLVENYSIPENRFVIKGEINKEAKSKVVATIDLEKMNF